MIRTMRFDLLNFKRSLKQPHQKFILHTKKLKYITNSLSRLLLSSRSLSCLETFRMHL